MASTNFIGAGGSQYYDDIHKLDNCWHKGPTMSATGTMTASRTTGNLIEGTISGANSYKPTGTYGYSVKIVIASSAGGTIKINNTTKEIQDYTIEQFNELIQNEQKNIVKDMKCIIQEHIEIKA